MAPNLQVYIIDHLRYVTKLEKQVASLTSSQNYINNSILTKVATPRWESPGSARFDPLTAQSLTSNQDIFSSHKMLPHENIDSINISPDLYRQSVAPKEVTYINCHTKNVEFYGRSSSMTLLHRVGIVEGNYLASQEGDDEAGCLVSILHNPVFSPGLNSSSVTTQTCPDNSPAFHYRCRSFLNDFFGTVHYTHPILDKARFLANCEDLWSGVVSPVQSPAFIALYYSVMSLGALFGARDEEQIEGMSNNDWSQKFFDEARTRLNEISMMTDLEMVQCYFFMVRLTFWK